MKAYRRQFLKSIHNRDQYWDEQASKIHWFQKYRVVFQKCNENGRKRLKKGLRGSKLAFLALKMT